MKVTNTLKGHTRTVTDFNWSYGEPSIFATASYDYYMHIWDLRDSRLVDRMLFCEFEFI